MHYKEFLRVRHALLWFLLALFVTGLFIAVVNLASGSHVGVTVGDMPTRNVPGNIGDPAVWTGQGSVPKVEDVPWVALLAAAGFIATIMATVFGSTLSQENEHLAIAWTKPRSRTQYATTVMLIDAAGIIVAQLMAFVGIVWVLLLLAHDQVRLVSGADDLPNLLRFMLFPLAWYGLIVAFSARLRNRAGIVQGLIWPASFTLALLLAAPLPPMWHQIFVIANYVNPLIYTAYVDHASATNINAVGGNTLTALNAGVSALVLAAFVVASWYAATSQWRKLEA